jgi:hypothetical protein
MFHPLNPPDPKRTNNDKNKQKQEEEFLRPRDRGLYTTSQGEYSSSSQGERSAIVQLPSLFIRQHLVKLCDPGVFLTSLCCQSQISSNF